MLVVSLFLCLLPLINGANILVYIGMGAYSHRIPIDPYINALAERGHKITFISWHPPKNPNPKITEFHPPKLLRWSKDTFSGPAMDVFRLRHESQNIQLWFNLARYATDACQSLYNDPSFLTWIKDPSTEFDIVVMDTLDNECAYGWAHYFKAKLIAFNTAQVYAWNPESNYGFPDESSSVPDAMSHPPTQMHILWRTWNALVPLAWKVYREYYIFPKLEQMSKKGLGINLPSFVEMEKNTSLVFINNHWALDHPRALPPNVISVGGITYQGNNKKPLPKKLEDFIQKGNNGFIYVSFGTVAEFAKFKPEIRKPFIKIFERFPQIQFILKSTFPVQDKLPDNVLVDKWLPQADILKHDKIRAYVTHGGLGGIYEAIYAKVPMICFPVFGEQDFNADLMVHRGFGIKLEITDVKEEELYDAISKMLADSSYKKQVTKVSEMLTDRPISPLDEAVWWTEYILKADGLNDFIRPLSVQQSWWVRRQLDVWLLILLTAIGGLGIFIFLTWCLVKCTFRKVFGSGKAKRKEKRH